MNIRSHDGCVYVLSHGYITNDIDGKLSSNVLGSIKCMIDGRNESIDKWHIIMILDMAIKYRWKNMIKLMMDGGYIESLL